MKHLFTRLFAVLVLAGAVCGFQAPAHAEFSIAVVDVEKVLNEADAAKALNQKRAAAREKFFKTLSKEEKSLRDEGQALFDKRKELGDEEFAKQQRTYQEKLAKVGKETQQNRRAFEQASNIALEKLKNELAIAVRTIANQGKYNLVISNRNVIAGENSLDITDETIKAMNEKNITIPFDFK